MPATLECHLRDVLERIEAAARDAGRDPAEVRLLPVTKSVEPETALALARLGRRELAENRLEGLERKRARFAEAGVEVEWHFIGHLQRNKARRVLRQAAVIHSIDSARLLETVERVAAEEGLRPRVFLEVKLAPDAEKHGLAPAELDACVRLAARCAHVELLGLMTLAPLVDDPAEERAAARDCFKALAAHARRLEADPDLARAFAKGRVLLSMGMSGDYEEAVRAGSHVVRVGSALFPRDAAEAAR